MEKKKVHVSVNPHRLLLIRSIITGLCIMSIAQISYGINAESPQALSQSVQNADNINKERQKAIRDISCSALRQTLMVLHQQEEEAKKDLVVANKNIQKDMAALERETARLKALMAQIDGKPPIALQVYHGLKVYHGLQGSEKLKQDLAVGCILQVNMDSKTKTVNACR